MGMPEIPDGKNRPTLDETIIDLLESIALEEMAIAHILNAEGEKLQEVIKRYSFKDLCFDKLNENCKCTQGILSSLILKEWLLLNKMEKVLELRIKCAMGDEEKTDLHKYSPCKPKI